MTKSFSNTNDNMTYYTIELSDGFSTWIHKTTTNCIQKYNVFEEARDAADLLLQDSSVTKYHINKFEQTVIRSIEKETKKEKEKELPKTRDKIVFKMQFESRSIPYKWLDTDGEFANVLHAQMILEHQRNSWPDGSFRLVKREYFYQEEVVA